MAFCYTGNADLIPFGIGIAIILSILISYFLIYRFSKNFVGTKKALALFIINFFILFFSISNILGYTVFNVICI